MSKITPSRDDCDLEISIKYEGKTYKNSYYRFYSYCSKSGEVKEIDLNNYPNEVEIMAKGEPVDLYDNKELAFEQVSFFNNHEDFYEYRLVLTKGETNLDRQIPKPSLYAKNNEYAMTAAVKPAEPKTIKEVLKGSDTPQKKSEYLNNILASSNEKSLNFDDDDINKLARFIREDININDAYAIVERIPKCIQDKLVSRDPGLKDITQKREFRSLAGVTVKSLAELIIYDRAWNYKNVKGSVFKSVKYETRWVCGRLPDFFVDCDGQEYIWEHLGGWDDPSYRIDNLTGKLKSYFNAYEKKSLLLLPRLTFPEKCDMKFNGNSKEKEKWDKLNMPTFLDVTSSEDNLKKFLEEDPYASYKRLFDHYGI